MPKAQKKLYNMPEKIPEGTILTDYQNDSYRVGPSIGIGGFGEVYSACRIGEKSYDYVIKCEPSENGPLFVEVHFYMRCGKQKDVKKYKKNQGLKSLGMPHFVSSGSVTLNEKSHRFLVMPHYGQNIEHFFLSNGKRLPVGTVYRLAIQMLDVLQYIHQCGYVHGDLKATNILLGSGKNGNAQAYLVDFGLAARYHTDRDFKPDPKKAHNGTVEFESRDAHQGVVTMRSDLEILGYNLIFWLGVELPWTNAKILKVPNKVQAAKMQFMNNLENELKTLFPDMANTFLLEYFKYIDKLKYNETPDYAKCRKIFQDALKTLKVPDIGDLELEFEKVNRTNTISEHNASAGKEDIFFVPKAKKVAKSALKRPKKNATKPVRPKSSLVCGVVTTGQADAAEAEKDIVEPTASDDDDHNLNFEPKRKKTLKPVPLKTTKISTSPAKRLKTTIKKITPYLRSQRILTRSATAKMQTATTELENNIAELNADDEESDITFKPKENKTIKPAPFKKTKVTVSLVKKLKVTPKKTTPRPLRAKRNLVRGATALNSVSPESNENE